jgi:hypothetical protein
MSAFGTEANSRNAYCESVFRSRAEVTRTLDLVRVGRTGTLGITPLGILCPYLFSHIILSSCLSQIAKYVFRRR